MMTIQQKVNAWQDDAFGHLNTFENIRQKLGEEITELASVLWPEPGNFVDPENPIGHRAKIADECADVVIVLMGLAKNQGFDLLTEVERKLEINRERIWNGINHV